MLQKVFAVNKDKAVDIHLLRGFAASAVVLIHLVNIALINVEQGEWGYWFFRMTHSLLQFAVPCFIFISSVVLAYSVKDKPLKLLPYYWKKVTRILFPYFVWSLMYIVGQVIIGHIPVEKLINIGSWFYWLAYGKAYTHLYFMSVIIQFYIIAPLLIIGMKWLCKHVKKYQLSIVLLIAIIPQIAVYWVNKLYIYQYFKSTATLFPWYWCISIVGLWIGLNYADWDKCISKHKKSLSTLSVVGIFTYMGYQYALYTHGSISTFLYQMVWYWYVGIIAIGGLYVMKRLSFSERIKHGILWISEHSFCIYLLHPVLTFAAKKLITLTNPIGLTLILGILFVVIVLICGVVSYFLQTNSLFWIVLGQRKKTKVTYTSEKNVNDLQC